MAACDVNGDGITDLAVTAPYDEDIELKPKASNQGAIHIFFGKDVGLSDVATQKIYGSLPNGPGQWRTYGTVPCKKDQLPPCKTQIGMGMSLTAGDFNGDNVCDLGIGNGFYDTLTGTAGDDGLVMVYLGQKATNETPGGLSPYPHRVWEAKDTMTGDKGHYESGLGGRLAAGDLDDDGLDELLATQPGFDSVRVFSGASMAGPPGDTVLAAGAAALSLGSGKAGESYGADIRVADINEDGVLDIVAGTGNANKSAGIVRFYAGVAGALPNPTQVASVTGLADGDNLGSALAVLNSVNDESAPHIVVMGRGVDTAGPDVGRPYLLPGGALTAPGDAEAPSPLTPLAYPVLTSGAEIGRRGSVALLGDMNGDGQPELAMGIPKGSTKALGRASGDLLVYLGTPDGIPLANPLSMAGQVGHYKSSNMGFVMANVGDFDGNGASDLAQIVNNAYNHAPWVLAENIKDGKVDPKGWATPQDWTQMFVLEDKCDDKWTQTMDPAPWTTGWSNVYIQSGSPSGLGDPPEIPSTFMFASPYVSQILGNLDYNGDGRSDLVVSGWNWSLKTYKEGYGGVAFVQGRDSIAGADIHVICRPDWAVMGYVKGGNPGGYFGEVTTPMGDLDSDGCDDIAVSATWQIRIIYGFGPKCKYPTPRQTTLVFTDPGEAKGAARLGKGYPYSSHSTNFSLAGGTDLDGDNIPDLIAGSPNYDSSFSYSESDVAGAVWFLAGAWLKTLETEAPSATTPPTKTYELPKTVTVGSQANVKFGFDVAIIPNLLPGNKPAVAVGSLLHGFGNDKNVGGVLIYAYDNQAKQLAKQPMGVVVGETYRANGFFGSHVSARLNDGKPMLAVGADSGTAFEDPFAVENGTVYVFPLPSPN